MKEAHLARLLGDRLRVFQHDGPARFLHRLPGLIDADDLVGHAEEAQGAADPLLQAVGGAAADGDLPGAGHRFAFGDPIVGHGGAARMVAEHQEEGHLIRDDPAVDAGIDLVDTGDGRQALLQLGVQAAVRHIEGVGLRNQQVVAQPDNRTVILHHALRHRAQAHHRGHPDGDAEQGEEAAHGTTDEVLQDHRTCPVMRDA